MPVRACDQSRVHLHRSRQTRDFRANREQNIRERRTGDEKIVHRTQAIKCYRLWRKQPIILALFLGQRGDLARQLFGGSREKLAKLGHFLILLRFSRIALLWLFLLFRLIVSPRLTSGRRGAICEGWPLAPVAAGEIRGRDGR